MTTRRAFQFEADLDISDVTQGLRRIEMQSRRAGAAVGRVGSGLGRGAGGVGRTVGAGAGLGAGLAIFEQLIMKIFELFEGTPVLQTFITALDGIFKAAAPVIGVLLQSLTPILLALTPAIEPLARAMVPLVELFGAGLLIAVQLITPAIVLFAEGLEKVTTFIKNTVLAGFRFVVDALNKLPFVDIQVDLATTGSSFDTMAVQIETAGAMADDAEPKIKGAGDAIDGTGEQSGRNTAKFKALEDRIRTTTEATGGLAKLEARVAREREINAKAAERAATAAALWTRAADENRAAANRLTPVMGALSDEMDETYTATDNLGVIIGGTKGPAVDLANAIEMMTMEIEDNQKAADLNRMAFEGLTPELQAAAIEMGIFRGEIVEVGKVVEEVAMGLGNTTRMIMSGSGSTSRQRGQRRDSNYRRTL